MKVWVKKSEYVDAEITPRELRKAFMEHVSEQMFPDTRFRPTLDHHFHVYINKEGRWETEESEHGTFYRQGHRLAAEDEKEAMVKWESLLKLRRFFENPKVAK